MTSPDGQQNDTTLGSRPRVVIVGGGFGGLQAARSLRRADLNVLLVDRANHHLFRPLLYQVATALLPAGNIAPDAHTIGVTTADGVQRHLSYDYLVVAVGSQPQYFGHREWAVSAPPMKPCNTP